MAVVWHLVEVTLAIYDMHSGATLSDLSFSVFSDVIGRGTRPDHQINFATRLCLLPFDFLLEITRRS